VFVTSQQVNVCETTNQLRLLRLIAAAVLSIQACHCWKEEPNETHTNAFFSFLLFFCCFFVHVRSVLLRGWTIIKPGEVFKFALV
jgi:hypothetical protein